MAEKWNPGKKYYDTRPTENTVSASVHDIENQALLVEEHSGKFVIFVVEKTNPENVIGEVERSISEKQKAKNKALEWMNDNEDGF